jgi:hypothetical protein
MHVKGTEKFLNPYMPVVGMTPSFYRFNNLSSTIAPYVNEVQFYDPYTGALGPNISPNGILRDMSESILSDSRYKPLVNSQVVSKVYDNGKINVGLIGTNNDILLVNQILNAHFNQQNVQHVAAQPAVVQHAVVQP